MPDYTYPKSSWGSTGVCPYCGLLVFIGPFSIMTRDTDAEWCSDGPDHLHSISSA